MRGRKQSDRRIRLLLVLLLLVFGLSLARATWLQTVRAADLSQLASSQQHETVAIPAGRGAIVDRMGVQLAIGQEAVTVYANPRHITSPRVVALAAAKTLGVDADVLYPQLLDKSKGFIYIVRKADPEQAKALERRRLPGVGFLKEERRVYPQGGVAAHVLGYAGTDNRGLAGLELGLERLLGGRAGSETFVKDPFGRVLNVVESVPERPGRDVFLTIDHAIQANAESVLRSTVSQWGAVRATAVVLDAQSGGVLAMAVAPGFDANLYSRTPADTHRNVAVTDTYEPGSTFKLVTVAAALSEGLVNANTAFTLPYAIRVADRVVHDAEPRGTETMTVAQILSRSSNVGAITLAQLARIRAARKLDRPLRIRRADGNRLPRRVARHRAARRSLVRLDDRQRPHRPGHRRDARTDGRGVCSRRQRRHLDSAAPRRPCEWWQARAAGTPPHPHGVDRRAGDGHARERRAGRNGNARGCPRLYDRRQDRHGGEAG